MNSGPTNCRYIFNRSGATICALNNAKNSRERSMLRKHQLHREADVLLSLLHICKIVVTALFLLLFISRSAIAEIKDDKANRIVSGIISFTHWPGLTGAPQLCVFSSA